MFNRLRRGPEAKQRAAVRGKERDGEREDTRERFSENTNGIESLFWIKL